MTARQRASDYFRNFTVLKTARLVFKPMCLEDAEELFDAIKNPRVYGWNATFINPLDLSSFRRWQMGRLEKMDAYEELFLTGRYTDTGTVMGYISIRPDKHDDSAVEIGGCLNELYWGKGFPEEVLVPVMQVIFETLGFSKVIGTTALKNAASMRLLEMMNFEYKGDFEKKFNNGNIQTSRLYELTPERWAARKFVGVDKSMFTAAELAERRQQLLQLCQDLGSLRE